MRGLAWIAVMVLGMFLVVFLPGWTLLLPPDIVVSLSRGEWGKAAFALGGYCLVWGLTYATVRLYWFAEGDKQRPLTLAEKLSPIVFFVLFAAVGYKMGLAVHGFLHGG
jgi:hypothetical protein